MRTMLPGLLVLFAAACASEPDKKSASVADAAREPEKWMIDYRGPEAKASLRGDELTVDVLCPTGGWKLAVGRTLKVGNHTRVELTLTGPADGEPVTQAFETKSQKVTLPAGSGDAHVRIQELQRGKTYIIQPKFKLAAVLSR